MYSCLIWISGVQKVSDMPPHHGGRLGFRRTPRSPLGPGMSLNLAACWNWQRARSGRKGSPVESDSAVGPDRAARAQSRGCFRAEIVPVTTTIHDDKGTQKSITVSQDEGIRPSTTMEGLAKLKPAFKDGGSTTAGKPE